MSIRVIITSGILLSLVLFPSLLFAGADNSSKVDLNRADAAELQSLPGIGPATAERIVQYRNENGRKSSSGSKISLPYPRRLNRKRATLRVKLSRNR